MALVAILGLTGAAFATAYYKLTGNIGSYDVSKYLPVKPKPTPTGGATGPAVPVDLEAGHALNILLMGSDSRSGTEEEGLPGTEGMRNDTTILLHISSDRKRVQLVSIPRDSWVTIPSCILPDGSQTQPRTTKFNASFSIGGQTGDIAAAAACSMNTVQELTGITLDGFIVVDMAGFKAMVDALGGVSLEIPEDINDVDSGLVVSQGWQHLNGDQALGYARVRKTIGDGSDIGRIARQQQLLGAIFSTALSKNVMTDIGQLYGFLDAATQSLKASPNYANVMALAGIAWSLRGIDPSNIQFVTVPWTDYDGSSILWTKDADALWESIRGDQPLPDGIEYTAPLAPDVDTGEPTSTVPAPDSATDPTPDSEPAESPTSG